MDAAAAYVSNARSAFHEAVGQLAEPIEEEDDDAKSAIDAILNAVKEHASAFHDAAAAHIAAMVDTATDGAENSTDEHDGSAGSADEHASDLRNTNLMPVMASGARRVGWMQKVGGGTSLLGRKNWTRRYFVQQDAMVSYYKPADVLADESVRLGATAAGYINLDGETVVCALPDNQILLETPKRAYTFACDSSGDARGWLDALRTQLNRLSGK